MRAKYVLHELELNDKEKMQEGERERVRKGKKPNVIMFK